MVEALIIGLVLLVGEFGVRLGMTIRGATDAERRITLLEQGQDRVFEAIRELKALIVNGSAAL